MVLDVEVCPKMPRKKSKTVLEGNGSVPQDAYVMTGGTKTEKFRPIMSEALDKTFDEPTENMIRENQLLAGLKQEAQKPHLAIETPRLASARRAPLQQIKRSMGITFMQKGYKPVRQVRPASA